MFQYFRSKRDGKTASNKIIQEYRSNPQSPFLISFPRTGSHWLRMLLERYSDQPLLVRSFFDHSTTDFLLLHSHDMNLTENRKNVLYLYRYPTDVIYSQINFYQQDFRNRDFVLHWINQYAVHLIHWVFKEDFTEKKTLISYEKLKTDLSAEFQKALIHFGLTYDENKLLKVKAEIDKNKVIQQTKHDRRVMNLSKDYETNRTWFREQYDAFIFEQIEEMAATMLIDVRPVLNLFDYKPKA